MSWAWPNTWCAIARGSPTLDADRALVIRGVVEVVDFAYALRTDFKTPLDLLYLALGTILVAGAIKLSHKAG